MITRKIIHVILAISFCCFAAAYADDIAPIADMYTDPDHADPHPTEQLWAANYSPQGHYERIMMKFDLDDYMGREIESAILNLYRFFGCPSGGITSVDFYHITVDWNEDTWPANVHIQHDNNIWAHHNFSVNDWHQIDITDMVQQWLDGYMENYGFVMQAQSGSKFSKFYSRESSQSYRPHLAITGISGINEQVDVPDNFTINAYPNPFNNSTTISYNLIKSSDVAVEIYNILGHKVKTLVNTVQHAGNYQVAWNAADLSSGVYFYTIKVGEIAQTKKLVLLK
ncbi:MAG: DNRLRE domain-containing protein [candidate division Zixibacteria bacterium]|nr:DNRLRE domain-containing protein [candidate division Zixibacteria bacterium]